MVVGFILQILSIFFILPTLFQIYNCYNCIATSVESFAEVFRRWRYPKIPANQPPSSCTALTSLWPEMMH